MDVKSFLTALKKNAMLVVLVLVYLFFVILTKGGIFSPSSFTELINQNAYVYTISNYGIKVNDANAPKTEIAVVKYQD